MGLLEQRSASRGYFLRREAVQYGVDDRSLTAGVRRKQLVRIRQGAYCHMGVWATLSTSERHLALTHASYDLTPGDVAISHVSALAEFGCPLWSAPLEHPHLTRLDGGSSRREAGVIHHAGALGPDQIVLRRDRRVTNPTRSTIDGLTLLSIESGMVSGDWMIHEELTSFDLLWACKTLMNHWPDTRTLEITLRLLDGRSESVGESRARYLFWIMGLPMPELQWHVFDKHGRLVGITDFAWPTRGVYGEFDGKVKYGRLLKPGQHPGDAVFAEKQREDAIRRTTDGTIVRHTWTDLHQTSAPSLQLLELLRKTA